MGFVRSALALSWPEDSEFHGLKVRMKRMSIRQLQEVQALQDLHKGNDERAMESFGDILDVLAGSLISWNLEDEVEAEDGTTTKVPVPATREALDDQDVDMVLQVVSAWTEAAAAVPLALKTTSGGTPPESPLEGWDTWIGQNQEPLPEPALS